ncbi:MAG: 50S ribosome-binding GTPase [Candidatus Thiocaldithrix dubininis]|uniref:50S ribosome-binding GTPase n=1 Tax=Candidatus Thiocaldithrix dubininis TaxID=3080823 RepID=A0AA95H747_9GAMM|nr:MAG: 50S ribosome-binding GTPase [Candidatus Thiocaldithrix dubininis]
MKINAQLRWMAAGLVIVGTVMLLLFMFFATQSFLEVWDRLHQLPSWLFYFYTILILVIIGLSAWVVYRLLSGGKKPKIAPPQARTEPITQASLTKEIQEIESVSSNNTELKEDIAELKEELQELEERKQAGEVHIAFFGDVSTGKSSIIKAIIPQAGVEISLKGGSTREIHEYTWQTANGDKLLLTDLPGRNEADGFLDEMSRQEAIRAQIVVYVTDSDLTRSQYEDILELAEFGKPMVIAVNKADQYTNDERKQIVERIQSRFNVQNPPTVVFIQGGGTEEVLRIFPDGREETIQRPRKVIVKALADYLQTEIDQHLEQLTQLRDASVYHMVQDKLDNTRIEFRQQESEKIIRSSTIKAILGALASVTPGTDLVVQGVIGTRMVQDLCKLYGVPVRQLDIDEFFNFSQGQLKKSLPILLAVAGNGLKAFPGIGTVAGGLIHAVAYGLIFDALGHAVSHTLEEKGSLKPATAAVTFQEMLSGNLEERTKTFARLVVEQYRNKES